MVASKMIVVRRTRCETPQSMSPGDDTYSITACPEKFFGRIETESGYLSSRS